MYILYGAFIQLIMFTPCQLSLAWSIFCVFLKQENEELSQSDTVLLEFMKVCYFFKFSGTNLSWGLRGNSGQNRADCQMGIGWFFTRCYVNQIHGFHISQL